VADQVSSGAGNAPSGVMAPKHVAPARVDDKGRLKLPSEFLEYLRALEVDKVFITTVDMQMARIYPMLVWQSNEELFSDAGENSEIAEDISLIAKVFGGDSEIDNQGRVLMPAKLRDQLELESQPVWLDVYKGRINVATKAVHEARFNRATVDLLDKVKIFTKFGMK
jgi:MraZ protein